jgi:hypothetical protein
VPPSPRAIVIAAGGVAGALLAAWRRRRGRADAATWREATSDTAR